MKDFTIENLTTSVIEAYTANGVEPRMKVGDTTPVLEDELMNLADTQMRTQFSTKTLHDHFQMLRTSITGRQ